MLTTLFLLQSAVPPEAPLPPIVPRCATANPDEIIVCGTRDSRTYRLDPLPEARSALKTAETTVGDATVGIVAEQGEVGGIPTNRAMIRLKFKF